MKYEFQLSCFQIYLYENDMQMRLRKVFKIIYFVTSLNVHVVEFKKVKK